MSQKDRNMLLYAAIIGKNIELVKDLLEDGYFINFEDEEGVTAWFVANNTTFGGGNQELIEMLLEYGTDIEAKDRFNHTVLHEAVSESDTRMTRFLLEHGASIDCVSENDIPLIIQATIDNNIEIVGLLLEYGADINVRSSEGYSPLYWAQVNNNLDLMEMLLKNGADPDIDVTIKFADLSIDLGKESLLNRACGNNDYEMVNLLLKYGANPNGQTNKTKISCLHWACSHGNFKMVKRLVEEGADTQAKDAIGSTPALYALSKGFNEIFNYLLLK